MVHGPMGIAPETAMPPVFGKEYHRTMWIEDGTEGRVCTWYRSGFSVSVGHLFYGTLCKTYLNEKLVEGGETREGVAPIETNIGTKLFSFVRVVGFFNYSFALDLISGFILGDGRVSKNAV
jgi:hypothetical protein